MITCVGARVNVGSEGECNVNKERLKGRRKKIRVEIPAKIQEDK